MKLCKLIVHTKSFCSEDLLLNQKDFPNLKIGNIVEIYHPEDEFSRLLLQVNLFKEDMQAKDTISVEQSIASTFQLRTYNDVYVNLVSPETVALDLVEIIFKDQYMGRSEMWRLKNSLVNTCVYLNKKIEFCSGSVRCQVHEMWSLGDRVACGVIVESTKIVFRSLTSMVYLFLQMSSEMWDFDIHGDLYFEKAVNGFLADLFQKWKNQGSNHEVTIVLFSRTFYKAHSLEDFPHYMRECLQQDYKGRFYEDFYRVAVQNEKYEDWSNTLVELRRLFSSYRQLVLEYNNRPNVKVPKAVNSTASQGNFLEVLNMSLNVFEKHYLDRSFDRTGQLSVVITPGVGVFDVDRELTNVTKQRVIDNGVGSDLVCLGEQPLHAVPLFKFHNKDSTVTGEDYSMPHWINLSFYSSDKRVTYSNFIPRIKLPPKKSQTSSQQSVGPIRTKPLHEEDRLGNSALDYDLYDAQVFNVPHVQALNIKGSRASKKTSVAGLECMSNKVVRRKMSDPDIHYYDASLTERCLASRTPAISIPPRSGEEGSFTSSFHHDAIVERIKNAELHSPGPASGGGGESTDSPPRNRITIGSGSPNPTFLIHQQPAPPRPGRALINPFDPSHITIKLTSNRRRWTHLFPRGPTGNLIQQHHYKVESRASTSAKGLVEASEPKKNTEKKNSRLNISSVIGHNTGRRSTLLWGVTGEQEWTPALTTGVDWKSLTIPACLPITTDYFPDDLCLKTDYLFSDYNLLPDDVNADYAQQRVIYRKPLQTIEVFNELISQRLAQGFQIIVDDNNSAGSASSTSGISVNLVRRQSEVIEYKLSIGRIFHRIILNGSEIRVTRYRPRHAYPPFNFHYWYRFQAPHHPTYGVSWISFTTEKLENFNWNYFDNYICTRGDTDFALVETLKYWRFRFFLIPMSQTATKKILDGAQFCDIYTAITPEEQQSLIENFLKFIEIWVNKIKRQPCVKKQRLDLSVLNMPSLLNRRRYSTGIIFTKSSVSGNSPFRERLGSNRLPEKHRPRSGSKVMEKCKLPSADSFPSPSDSEQSENQETSQTFVIKENTPLCEVVEHLKSPNSRLSFLCELPSLPKFTFVSYEAIQWFMNHMEGINSKEAAQSFIEKMIKEKYLCHASGDFSMPLLNGFYLYSLVSSHEDLKVRENEPVKVLNGFDNEWVEIETKQDAASPHESCFLYQHIPPPCSQANQKGPVYKESHLEIDIQGKSDRVEWGHLKYQSTYKPNMAYEMVVQWTAASGAIVADLVYNWARKAQSCGLQLIPIPADPFALPYSLKSDPLRGPIFIPLDTESLMETRSYLFEEFEEDTWTQRLVLLQDAIAVRFGFIRCAVENAHHQHNQYVHLSGNVFLLIPSLPCVHVKQTPISRSRQVRRTAPAPEVPASPHHEYITRHVGSQTLKHDPGVGFLWSWNHMISRKWRMGSMYAAGDESFQNKLLSDFQEFCSNGNNRLKLFWDSCCSAAKKIEAGETL